MQARLRERFLSKRLNLRLLPSRRGKTQIRVPVSRGYMDSSVQTNCEGLSVRYLVPLVLLLAACCLLHKHCMHKYCITLR